MIPRNLVACLFALLLCAGCKSKSATEGSNFVTVVITPSRASLEVGQQRQLSVKVTGPPGTAQEVVWLSANPDVATVTSNGLVHAVGAGATPVWALWATDTLYYGTAEIQVTSVPIVGGQPPISAILKPKK